MKKFLVAAALAALVITLPAVSQENEQTKQIWDHGDNVSSITYQNVKIYKIYDQMDSYIVIYEKQGIKLGKAVIPKDWTDNTEGARKLNFRSNPKGISPYMTIIKQNGEFLKVIISAPVNRFDAIWGMAPSGMQVEGTDAETLSIEY